MSQAQNEVRITTEMSVKKYAEVVVNGRSLGKKEINGGPSLFEFAQNLARENGLRSFNVTFNDATVKSAEQARNTPVGSGDRVAVSAKDTRGSR